MLNWVLLIHFGNGSQFNKQNEWCARVKDPGLMLSFKYTSERGLERAQRDRDDIPEGDLGLIPESNKLILRGTTLRTEPRL